MEKRQAKPSLQRISPIDSANHSSTGFEGILPPDDLQRLKEFTNLLRQNVTALRSKSGVKNGRTRTPSFDRTESADEIEFSYGLSSVVVRKSDGAFRVRQTAGPEMIMPQLFRDDPGEKQILRQATDYLRDPEATLSQQLTAFNFLQICALQAQVYRLLTPARLAQDRPVVLHSPEHPSGRVLTDMPPLFVEIAIKISVLKGRWLERFQIQQEEHLALLGRRHQRAVTKGGDATAATAIERWRKRMLALEQIAAANACTFSNGCEQVAMHELGLHTRTAKCRSLGKSIARGLRQRYPMESKRLMEHLSDR